MSQKTAWFINRRLRAILTEINPEILSSTIEVDEPFVGGKEKNRYQPKKKKKATK